MQNTIKFIFFLSTINILLSAGCDSQKSVSTFNSSTGKAGSLARFTIVDNYLYTVDNSSLNVFNISNPNTPVFLNKINIGMSIETIFPFKDRLFIASNLGMYTYTISNPSIPVKEGFVQHLTGCDPVVANDSVAFLTIHGGTRCNSSINMLDIYDIKNDINNPVLIKSINMNNPQGLGLKDNYLFVCDKGIGMKIYEVSNPKNPLLIRTLTDETYMDVIIQNDLLVAMLTDGVAYYDISNMNTIVKISTVKN